MSHAGYAELRYCCCSTAGWVTRTLRALPGGIHFRDGAGGTAACWYCVNTEIWEAVTPQRREPAGPPNRPPGRCGSRVSPAGTPDLQR